MANNPMQNPTVQLCHDLRDPTSFPNPAVRPPLVIHLSPLAPQYLVANLEDVLKYIKHEPFDGIEEFATIQIFKDRNEAYNHWTFQKRLDSKFFLQPQRCVKLQKPNSTDFVHVLMFEIIVRDFRVWKSAHANNTNRQVLDKEMLELVKQIGIILRYLSTEIQTLRSHGNLHKGVAITKDLRVLFFNMGAANLYLHDVQEFEGMLASIEMNMQDVEIKGLVNRWKTFFSTSCLAPNPIPVPSSHLFTPFNPYHLKLIFNYPSVWNHEDCLRFLANMHNLCKNADNSHRNSNLLNNHEFVKALTIRYPQWDSQVTATTSVLNEVFQFGKNNNGNYTKFIRRTGARVQSEASIVIFAHNCVKHSLEMAQKYNNKINKRNKRNPKNNPATGATPAKMPELSSTDILAELRTKFPDLIEDIYEAFHRALAQGYCHHLFTVSEILTKRL